MTEYILIAVFIVLLFFGTAYLKDKYLARYKWGNIVTDISTFVLFLILFIFPKVTDAGTSLSWFRIVLLVILSLYFLYKIYKDIRLIRDQKN